MFVIADNWKHAHPEAQIGFLVMRGVVNPAVHPELEARKRALEAELRAQFGGLDRAALAALPPFPAYAAYYRRFKKTYHVQAQFESIVQRDRPLPSVAALVEAMFMAEVKNRLLTAGHDLDQLQLPITVAAADGAELYVLLRGQAQQAKAGDMLMADQAGVISSIVSGPDQRTQINAATRNVVFAVYAPPGIAEEAVRAHLGDIRDYVRLVAPSAEAQTLVVLNADAA